MAVGGVRWEVDWLLFVSTDVCVYACACVCPSTSRFREQREGVALIEKWTPLFLLTVSSPVLFIFDLIQCHTGLFYYGMNLLRLPNYLN